MLFLRIENLQISKRKEKSHRGYEKSILMHTGWANCEKQKGGATGHLRFTLTLTVEKCVAVSTRATVFRLSLPLVVVKLTS